MTNPEYDGELLHLAYDLGNRLLPAFHNTATGMPHPRGTVDTPLKLTERTILMLIAQ